MGGYVVYYFSFFTALSNTFAVDPKGGMALDPRFMIEMEEGMRPHQVRLQGGDASSDSFCYPS